MQSAAQSSVAMSRVGCALLVTVPKDLHQAAYQDLRHAILEQVQHQQLSALVLDMTAVDILDDADVRVVIELVRACRLLGARSRVVGLRPSLCAYLASIPETDELDARFGVEEALQELQAQGTPRGGRP